MDIKRTILWVVFSMSLLILWDNWMRHNGKPSMFFPNATQVAKNGEGAPGQTGVSGQSVAVPVSNNTAGAAASATAIATAAVPGATGELITIHTDVVEAEIDTLGGELRHLELLQHKDGTDHQHNLVLFDASAKRTYLAQSGLLGGAFPNHKSLFVVKPGQRTPDALGQVQVVLEAEESGVKLIKTYTFKNGSYLIDLQHQIVNSSAAAITPSVYLQLVRDGGKLEGESRFYSTFTGPAVYTDEEKFQKLTFDKIEKGSESHATKANNGWAALIQHYFVSAIIPQDKVQREIFTKKVSTNLYAVGNIMPMGTIAPGASTTLDAHIYSGPQVTSILEQVAPGFDLVKDYGWTTIVARPVFWLMGQIHHLLGNWGWTIIVLTICIKLVFFPLSAASYRSMGKMKLLTPKMTAIRERHKDDPQKMNQAMMELYKTEKVNPLGGCLPILIQTPVFISLYSVVLASVELRNAPWLGWIHDLASPDPLYILPILMAASMFAQTKLNPAPADPMQAKMMMIMPLVFSFMFFFFPSGLVLYWVVNNLLSITQQWVITRKIAAKQ